MEKCLRATKRTSFYRLPNIRELGVETVHLASKLAIKLATTGSTLNPEGKENEMDEEIKRFLIRKGFENGYFNTYELSEKAIDTLLRQCNEDEKKGEQDGN
jgi:hypothetical protein